MRDAARILRCLWEVQLDGTNNNKKRKSFEHKTNKFDFLLNQLGFSLTLPKKKK